MDSETLIKLTFRLVKWEQSKKDIIRIRKKVFMDEYDLPLNFLRHRDDEERYHILAINDVTGKSVGTGCIHPDGHIGRIAILRDWRETNSVAHVIVDYLMHVAKTLKQDRVWLNAPVNNLDDYSYRDFYPMGTSFEYCGVKMQMIELWREVEENNKIYRIINNTTDLAFTTLSQYR